MAGFNRTLSPQGDGNIQKGGTVAISAESTVQQNPFPARGRKPKPTNASCEGSTSTSVQQNPFPARGRKPDGIPIHLGIGIAKVQQNPFPARGRKLAMTSSFRAMTSSRSTEPFPRKGTETYVSSAQWVATSRSVQQNPFPARGRKP